jgi:hypothetical protein
MSEEKRTALIHPEMIFAAYGGIRKIHHRLFGGSQVGW